MFISFAGILIAKISCNILSIHITFILRRWNSIQRQQNSSLPQETNDDLLMNYVFIKFVFMNRKVVNFHFSTRDPRSLNSTENYLSLIERLRSHNVQNLLRAREKYF